MAKKSKASAAAARRRQQVSRSTVTAQPAPKPVDLREEYRYVLTDLKRFAILAASMIVLLVVLALVF